MKATPKGQFRSVATSEEMTEVRLGGLNQQNTQSRMKSLGDLVGKRAPIGIEWRNVTYTLPEARPRQKPVMKTILNNLSGFAQPGRVLAIMGPSGSGKTSLLAVLANRVVRSKGADLAGHVLVGGQPRDDKQFGRISAFVTQDDILYSMQTVRETLWVAAQLRLPGTIPNDDKRKYVDGIIMELGLIKVANTPVGNEMRRGVSGGERKRVNIGIELISNPSILLLDEPTSGLDSFQAANVMGSLRDLAHNSRTVVCSIHQPRSSIFQMFDMLLLLSEGRVMFFGDARDAVSHFTRLGHPCPAHFNPADYFLDLVSMDYRSKEEEAVTSDRIIKLALGWKHSEEINPVKVPDGQLVSTMGAMGQPNERDGCCESTYSSSTLTQFRLLFLRSFRQNIRDKFTTRIRIVSTIIFALILGALYSETNYHCTTIRDRQGILFFIAINQAFGGLFNAVNTFPVERTIVMRERASKTYRASPYFLAKFLAELPLGVIPPALFALIVYFMANLNLQADRFFIFLAICCIESLTATALGLVISSIAPSVQGAGALGPPIMIIWILFGGFYINSKNVPIGAQWVSEISFIKWCYVALSLNEFEGETFWQEPSDPAGCFLSGDEVIRSLNFEDYSVWMAIVIVLALMTAFNLIAYLLLRFKKNKYLALAAPSPESTARAEEGDKLMKYIKAKGGEAHFFNGAALEATPMHSPPLSATTSTSSDAHNGAFSHQSSAASLRAVNSAAHAAADASHRRDGSSDFSV